MQETPTAAIFVEGREFLVKRDDLYDPYLSGNKYRKLYSLLTTPKERYSTIISYGGTQSNAMLALAALCREKSWRFIYYTKPLSLEQKKSAHGNFADALRLGMEHVEIEAAFYRDFIASLRVGTDERTLVVDQGGAMREARAGAEILASEIRAAQARGEIAFDAVATPSGTGTSAYFLAHSLGEYPVYTTPCVGDEVYLKEQMSYLGDIPQNLKILETPKKYHFAKPYREFYEIFLKLERSGVAFDLLYAPKMWLTLLEQTQERILYVHSGGISGNATMKERYAKKFGLADEN